MIGSLLSLSVVPFFSVPNDTVIRLLILPVGVVSAILPVLSSAWAVDETRARAVEVYRQAIRMVALVMIPGCAILAIYSHVVLELWMGSDFAANAAGILTVFSVGLLCNAISQIPNAALLATGRPDIAGKLQMVQLPIYGAVLFGLTSFQGIIGAASAWTLRVTVEMVAFLFLARRIMGTAGAQSWNRRERVGSIVAGTALMIILCAKLASLGMAVQLISLVAGLAAYSCAAWYFILKEDERASIKTYMLWRNIRGKKNSTTLGA